MANHKGNQKMPINVGKKYNRTVYDPRVDMFKQFYLSPDSYSFMNIRQSGLRAGYTDQYSRNISVQRPKWWTEIMESKEYQRAKMLSKAQDRLEERLTEPVTDVQNKKIQTDVAKFVTERLGKEHYSTRQELTDKGGKRLFGIKDDNADKTLSELFAGVQAVSNSDNKAKNKQD